MPRPPNIPKRKFLTLVKSPPQQNQVATLLQQGLALHQQGKFKDAQAIYEKVLAIQENHFDALQLLGALSMQTKELTKAVDFLTKALKINPNHAACYSNRGIVLEELKHLDEALTNYDKAISIKPDYAEAYSNRGNVLQQLGCLYEALTSYDKAISFKPDFVEAYSNRGNVLKKMGRLYGALTSYDKAISFKPDYAESYSNRGNVLQQLGRFDEALTSYDKAISFKPDYAEAYSSLGNVLKKLGRLDEALTNYDKAISIKPDYADAHSNRGVVLEELKRSDEALISHNKAISIKPDYAEAYSNRGSALQQLGRLDEALINYDKAISIKPDYADAHSNRGNVLQQLGRLDEALISHNKAISIKPDYAEAYSNRGSALQQLGRLDEALTSYNKAISIKSDDTLAHWNLSLLHLLEGNFKNGWQGYEWRWKNENLPEFKEKRNFSEPLWLGAESLKDKTILLYAEQGLGDSIQFCRYVPLVAQLGARVILEVQRPLVKLLKGIEGVNQIIAKGDALPNFDYQCPLLSLPLAFKTELHTIPQVSYHITSDREKVAKWKAILGEKVKPRVGLAWSGSAIHKNDHKRSLTLSKLQPYLNPDVDYICLQKEIRDIDKALLAQHREIKYFGDALEDFTDTAALCELMDVVISVDTSVAHLAGTLGKPSWVLLPFSPDWRWLLDRDDSPWYPSAKLYRQERIGSWNGVLEKVQSDLIKLVNLKN